METNKITIDNLSEKLNTSEIGGWSVFYLAEKALVYYFPDLEDENFNIERYLSCLHKLGFEYWNEVAIKYHDEVGFTNDEIVHNYVNEY